MLNLEAPPEYRSSYSQLKIRLLNYTYVQVLVWLVNLGDGVVHEFSLNVHEPHAYKSVSWKYPHDLAKAVLHVNLHHDLVNAWQKHGVRYAAIVAR